MNANKLVDELEGFGYLNSDDGLHFCPFQAQVDMLRQQQAKLEKSQALLREYTALNMRQKAEIEALKSQVLAWENAEVPTEVMADLVEELERRGFITK